MQLVSSRCGGRQPDPYADGASGCNGHGNIYSRRHDLAGLASFTMLALLGNAFICGALSNPHHRYQSRILWLAPLVVGMTIVCWWQLRMKNFKSAGTATGRPLNPDLR